MRFKSNYYHIKKYITLINCYVSPNIMRYIEGGHDNATFLALSQPHQLITTWKSTNQSAKMVIWTACKLLTSPYRIQMTFIYPKDIKYLHWVVSIIVLLEIPPPCMPVPTRFVASHIPSFQDLNGNPKNETKIKNFSVPNPSGRMRSSPAVEKNNV